LKKTVFFPFLMQVFAEAHFPIHIAPKRNGGGLSSAAAPVVTFCKPYSAGGSAGSG
jgi:hypothetical protein